MPIVSITALLAPLAAPKRILGQRCDVGVVVDEDRQAGPLATRSRIGRSSIGRLTAETATPCSWSIVAGIPIPIAPTPARSSRASPTSRTSSSTSSSSVWPVERSRLSQSDLGPVVEDADEHLGPAQIDAYRFGGAHLFRQATAGIGMIPKPFMPENDEQRPSGPPDYKVYKSRRGLLSRFRKPDLSGLRERCAEGAARFPARRGASPRSAGTRRWRPTAERVLKWVGLAALGWILLSFLAFAVSAQLQAFKLSGDAKSALHGNPLLLVKRADDPRARHRRPLA